MSVPSLPATIAWPPATPRNVPAVAVPLRCGLRALPPGSAPEGYVDLDEGRLGIGEHTLAGEIRARIVAKAVHEGTFTVEARRHRTRLHN